MTVQGERRALRQEKGAHTPLEALPRTFGAGRRISVNAAGNNSR
jgi:hypothetical protein